MIWFSKKQNTVDEFVAMRIAQDLIVSLRYKLRMFGLPLDGPTDVMCDNQGPTDVMNDNQGVAMYTRLAQSTLGKKDNAVNYVGHER